MPSTNSKPTENGSNGGKNATTTNRAAATAVLTGNGQQQRHQSECCSVAAFVGNQQQNGNNNNSNNTSQQHHNSSNNGYGNGGNGYHQHHHHNNNTNNPHRQPTAVVSLNARQVDRLRSVLDQEVQIHGRENFPTLEIPLHTLIVNMRRKLREANLQLKHVKLNGGAASFVFAQSDTFPYSDVDLIFPIALQEDQDFERVRDAVFDALLEMMPSTTNKSVITADTLRDVYIRKMVKVTDGDRWSLFSLHNDYGRCIELKFVEQMRRQFEFSVDSFQITLNPIIDRPNEQRPNVRAESMYGDFMQALYHLNKRLIDTRNPEEIRGGGLLKYCHLLTRGFSATSNCRDMEKYMCSRFFIDFPDINVQEMKLLNYLQNHFGNEDELKLDYLHKLFCVIRDSTVCLMYHERRQTLAMVDRLRQQLSYNLMLYYQQFEGNNSNITAIAQQQQHQYYSQQNGTGHNGRSRRYGYNQRYWHGSSRNNRYNNNNSTSGPMLCVSPVSTIASSSIVEDEQQQLLLTKAESDIVDENYNSNNNKRNAKLQQTEKAKMAAETVEGKATRQQKSSNNCATKNVGIMAIEQSQPVTILTKQKNTNDNRKEHLDVKRCTEQKQQQQQQPAEHIPRQTLLYLPPNSSQWIPVV